MDLVTALRLGLDSPTAHVISLTGGGGKTSTMRRLAGELIALGVRVVCTSTTRLAAYEVETAPGVVMVAGQTLPYDEIGRALDRHGQCLLVTPEIVEGGVQKYPGLTATLVDELAARVGALGIGAMVVEADGAKMLPLKAPAEHEPPLPASTTLLASIAGMDALGRRVAHTSVHRPERMRAVLGLDARGDERVTPARIASLLTDPRGGRKGQPQSARFVPILNKTESTPACAGARIAACLMAAEGESSLIASTGCLTCEPVHERWGPVAAVVLAAGEGSRFGGPKQVALVDGEPLLVRAVQTALEADVTEVVVVTGAHADQATACLDAAFGEGLTPRLRVVHNAEWRTGQAGSLHAALRCMRDEVQAVLFMPVDQPSLTSTLLRRLVRRWRSGYGLAAPRVDGKIRGRAGLFDRRYWPELLGVRGDRGGRDLLRTYADRVAAVAADGELLWDVDRQSDLPGQRLSRRTHPRPRAGARRWWSVRYASDIAKCASRPGAILSTR